LKRRIVLKQMVDYREDSFKNFSLHFAVA